MTGDRLRRVFLACGPLSALVYIGWHELAALQWEGYSRISNAISELHLTGAPSKWMLDPWEGLVYNALVIAFGIGVWRSAEGSRALRAIGGLQILSGATFPLWLLFGEASLAAHLVLAVVGILTWLGSMGFGAAAFGRAVPDLLPGMPRGGRDVQCPGPCICACRGCGGTNTVDRALRAHRLRRLLPVVVGTCRGPLAQAVDHVRA